MLALLALAAAPLELPAAGWIAFDAPAVAETERMGCDDDGRTSLMDDGWNIGDDDRHAPDKAHYERITVYVQLHDGEPRKVRAFTPDCAVDGANQATRISLGADEGVELLVGYLGAPRSRDVESDLIAALAHIDHETAGKVLVRVAEDDRDEDRSQDALFWLAQRRGAAGRAVVMSHLDARWPLDHREHAVMALAFSGHPRATDAVREVARESEPASLRAQAVMALGITDAPGALADLHSIFLVDPDSRVREQAIFALAQLDNPEAAAILADIIRQPRYGEHRRSALFWLAQMDDDSSQEAIDALVSELF